MLPNSVLKVQNDQLRLELSMARIPHKRMLTFGGVREISINVDELN